MAIINKKYFQENSVNKSSLVSDEEIEVSNFLSSNNYDLSKININIWPFFYYFSDLRKNAISWYDFKKNCSILEIGTNFGAFTDLYTEKSKRVVCIDNNYYSAMTNYNRNKNVDYLEIIIGNLNDIKISEKFDYVILIDYIEKNNSQDVISYAKNMLKKNGEILINADNKLGIKYLSGHNNSNSLFTKNELCNLIKKQNLIINKWYYPFPDSKFPFEVFTDLSINKRKPISSYFAPIGKKEVMSFDYNEAYSNFVNNGIADIFTNSFFITVSKTKKKVDNYDYFKISSLRSREFSTCVKINSKNKKVVKEPIYLCGLKHIKSMQTSGDVLNGFDNIRKVLKTNKVESALIQTSNLKDFIVEEVEKGNHNCVWTVFSKIKQKLYIGEKTYKTVSEKFIKVFGNYSNSYNLHWLEKANIDLVLENIFIQNNKYLLVDNEWTFDFEIPAEFIIYRALKYLDSRIKNKCNISIEKICEFLEIDNNCIEMFETWENNFLSNYVKVPNIPYCEYDTYENIKYKYEQVINSNIWKYTSFIRETADNLKKIGGKTKE